MSMNLRSLYQNKAPFGLDQLVKFVIFAWKSMWTICALSSRTDGTIVMKRPKETGWDPELVVGVTEDGNATLGNHCLATRVVSTSTVSG